MKKKTFTGWIRKTDDLKKIIGEKKQLMDKDEHIVLNPIFTKKGEREDWNLIDWPPVKVKVTIEVMEK